MTTPTCNHCGAKFPGKDFCKSCGKDPNTKPTVGERIQYAVKKKVQKDPPKSRQAKKAITRSIRASTARKKKGHGRP